MIFIDPVQLGRSFEDDHRHAHLHVDETLAHHHRSQVDEISTRIIDVNSVVIFFKKMLYPYNLGFHPVLKKLCFDVDLQV